MTKTIFLYIMIIALSSCASVEKHNQQIHKAHSPEKLKQDVDYAYKKLQRLHPDIYWYISKEELDKKINDLKDELTTPLTTREFYKVLAPVITSIKQGHLGIYTPVKKQTKKEIKLKGKRTSPFDSFSFRSTGNELVIKKVFKEDSTLLAGSEVLSVDDEKVSDLLAFFKTLHASDGYNETFIPKFVRSRFWYFYRNTHEQKDSILLKLRYKDSLYSKYLYASYDKMKTSSKQDTVNPTKKKLSKLERKAAKKTQRKIRKKNDKYGYNKKTNDYNRNLSFLEADIETSIAYMKIKSFTNGPYKEFYKEAFAKIDAAKCKNLIIDLRGNTGGRLNEIDVLYSYLTDKEYIFIEKSKMTGRLSFLYPFYHSKSWVVKTGAVILSPVLGIYQIFKVKKENGEAYFKFRHSKSRKPKPNSFTGKVYVLINGESFSASSILSTHLKATKRATFVGEETGGAYNGTVAGSYALVVLPNSKINMKIGLIKINAPYTNQPDGYGIMPDISLKDEMNIEDEDKELKWVIQDIEISSKKK